MESVCFACASTLEKADEIICSGFCKSSFHLKCAHQSSAIRDTVASCAQLFWMCRACTKMMSNATFRQAISSTNSVMQLMAEEQSKAFEELRKQIALNTTKINTILQRTPAQTTTPRVPRNQVPTNSRKRPRLQLPDEPTHHENPTEGTKDINPDDAIPLATAQRANRFWLYLSGFDPQATVQQIEKLVKQNVNTDEDIEVVKLVPKGKTLEQLTSVSFKVGIGLHLKDLALSGSTWQKGIIFRQFDFEQTASTRTIFRFRATSGDNTAQ